MYRGAAAESPVTESPQLPWVSTSRPFCPMPTSALPMGLVAVGVVLHAVADDVRHLVEPAVVHDLHGLHEAPLHGLEPVRHVGDGPVRDHVGRILQEVLAVGVLHGQLARLGGPAPRWRAGPAPDPPVSSSRPSSGPSRRPCPSTQPSFSSLSFPVSTRSIGSRIRFSMMSSRRFGGVLAHVVGEHILYVGPLGFTTRSRRISSPMNCPNSPGEISPSPLNRVISGFLTTFMASSRSRSE